MDRFNTPVSKPIIPVEHALGKGHRLAKEHSSFPKKTSPPPPPKSKAFQKGICASSSELPRSLMESQKGKKERKKEKSFHKTPVRSTELKRKKSLDNLIAKVIIVAKLQTPQTSHFCS